MSNSSSEAERLSLIANYVLSIGGLPIFICGIIGNSLNFIIFLNRSQLNKIPTSIFLLTSYSGSFMTLITGLLPQLVYRLTRINPLVNYLTLCKLRWFLGVGTATIAIHSLCFAAFQQYLVTTNSIRCHQFITRRRAIILCIFIYFYCAISVSPNLFYYTHVKNAINQTTCDVTNPIVSSYNAYNALIFYTLIPMSILSLFSILILRNIRKCLIRRPSLEQSVTSMLLAQIIIVLIATVAFCIRRIYIFYTTDLRKDSIRIAQDDIITNVSTLFGFSIHGFTFFIYLIISNAFRNNIFSLFFPRRHRIAIHIPARAIT
ncbi:hypothetical protein I4U23_012275 [Adineta vaga]|uniref:Neuromedin U receptor 2 G-protein coupled receptor-like protein n=1 Tax=Adineta vaga TaxID=104782 RepID=B3G470_ADIVA|nr:neuromedin U receptor 2 G-protein coupled receptor-like protein [Adineta vaga]UJR07996.1 hypothetical protein I4U23_012275 [Adineta vaga]